MAAVDLASLAQDGGRILLIVLDGLGGVASAARGTELEEADTPNLDRLAAEGLTGMLEPVGPGITPGSGPGHLALFGYDPTAYELGRGVLSAAGLGVRLEPGDVAARGNLCRVAADGTVVDRRAGRIDDVRAREVVDRLQREVRLDGVRASFHHERGHRVLVVLRGPGLDPRVSDTDPQRTGSPPLPPRPLNPAAAATAAAVAELSEQARTILAGRADANGLLLRGWSGPVDLPPFRARTGMRAAAIAVYPMYRGLATLAGFEVLGPPADLDAAVALLDDARGHDFVFWHYKDADAAGEDGDAEAKVAAIERLDARLPVILERAAADVIAVTGDHATPASLAAHSWHPVPLLVHAARAGRDEVERFGERWCRSGALGLRPSLTLLPQLMAAAGRLRKYGA
ncbi:MAG: putative 2,3-bisphosphoglycerate-independent phosphoglycerate mutase [Actinomycetota bacterium]|jgi:2,3-bisphosphoglycerate-independent phosphoglycerate mutase|nr:MAG: putative 2,3-bisphosphoglycerate-independent phosphoglycerate mutase [Actinomycetota bacterium]